MIFIFLIFVGIKSSDGSYIADRAKICGQSVGKYGLVESENVLK